ncbi:MAG: EamA family transporter [Fusobacteriaceae bacterium]|nr:EamA family transporter [Fusobacteriaceae bacterium]MBP9562292.1 EamA family transporter [Acetoanaerobium sp.]MBU9918247.1 DMT family transporter [Fusobacteriaceae bacterium]
MEKIKNNRKKGILLAVSATVFWGFSGNITQYMFQISDVDAFTIVALRLLISGLILTLFALLSGYKTKFLEIFKNKDAQKDIIIFTVFGMIGTQLTFFSAIENSNAAVATLLQFLSPLFIIFYYIFRKKQLPSKIEVFSTILALMGTFLIITNGSTKGLSVSIAGFVWGILSALAATFYMIFAKKLFVWPSRVTVGLSMFLGGILLFIILPNKNFIHYFDDTRVLIAFAFNIIFGTVLAFYFLIESLRYISEKEAAILSSCEPLTALLVAIVFVNTPFGLYQIVGSALILIMIFILAIYGKKN